jgi:hypothetical protein
MKTNRFWIETVALGVAIACALALLIATLATATIAVTERDASRQSTESTPTAEAQLVPAPTPTEQAYEGMVTCSRCGAKHSAKIGKTASDCARVCVHGGSGFALVDGDKMYRLEGDLNALKRVAGQRARIVGAMHGDTIIVSSIGAS